MTNTYQTFLNGRRPLCPTQMSSLQIGWEVTHFTNMRACITWQRWFTPNECCSQRTTWKAMQDRFHFSRKNNRTTSRLRRLSLEACRDPCGLLPCEPFSYFISAIGQQWYPQLSDGECWKLSSSVLKPTWPWPKLERKSRVAGTWCSNPESDANWRT